MGRPVVHFEIIGREPGRLREYYAALFGWTFDTSSPVSAAVSEPTDYGFTDADRSGGGGRAYQSHALFYVGVPDVEAALAEAEHLGGVRRMGPERSPSGLVVGQFTDPEGNLVGVASSG